MIENTLENKAKFFFIYYGQRIWRYSHSNGATALLYIDANTVHDKIYVGFRGHLELKPLSSSSITDKDAIEIEKIISSEKDVEILFDTISKEKALFECKYAAQYNKHYEVVDYLRSKGYALPYMSASVETMVEWGWIKLKDD